jgi:hypothetical protein
MVLESRAGLDLLVRPIAPYGAAHVCDRSEEVEVLTAIESQVPADQVDRLIELYCEWRIEASIVRGAYGRFSDADAADRTLAFAAYLAALDRERAASDAYAEQIRLVLAACAASEPAR